MPDNTDQYTIYPKDTLRLKEHAKKDSSQIGVKGRKKVTTRDVSSYAGHVKIYQIAYNLFLGR